MTTLKWLIPKLEEQGEMKVKKAVREKLFRTSAASVDRLLKAGLKKYELKARARKKPGSLLKHQVKIRTFCKGHERRPSFLKIDLVRHDGGKA
ncbi:MAG: hypothetical protein QW279_05510 [Candidatus Jordarchaeaceae archaeon]